MISKQDTIAAITTPPGIGGVAVIRISGEKALEIAKAITGKNPPPRQAVFSTFHDSANNLIDSGLMLYFAAPHSFTGEDVVELQGHGGMAVSQALLQSVLDYGARLAEAGEFSHRAFLNGKIDLTQAEAIADLIAARSQAAVKAAASSLSGAFSQVVNQLAQDILALRVYIEAALDFPEEEIDFLSEGDIENRLLAWGKKLDQLIQQTTQGQLINDGIRLVLAGAPNAGKSSLLNALVGEERAIVTDQAGTTRDIIQENLIICGIPIHILDTAGLRESGDLIEAEGIRRTRMALQKADLILLLIDGSASNELIDYKMLVAECPTETPLLTVYNKVDCLNAPPNDHALWISAKTGAGLTELKQAIVQAIGATEREETPFIARERHVRALKEAKMHYQQALMQLQGLRAGELVADDLRLAHDALGSITGKVSSDDLLGHIFSSFCIGK